MIATMRVNESRMAEGARGGFMAATDLADYLAAHDVPFREAHEIVGALVLSCERAGKTLQELTLEELQAASPTFEADALGAVEVAAVVARRESAGGTAPVRVAEQLAAAQEQLAKDEAWREERVVK